MDTLKFTITNNAWINNGLARLVHEMEDKFEEEVFIRRGHNSVEFGSNTENEIYYYLNEVIKFLAADGTYNYAQVFKIINKELDGSFSPPNNYPITEKDAKKKEEIPEQYKDELKKMGVSNDYLKGQIWKMRLNYLGKNENYRKYGLNFNQNNPDSDFKLKDADNIYLKLKSNEGGKEICPICGCTSKNFIGNKRFFNPLLNEHHNNEIEGIGAMRKKIKSCPNCATLAFISLFDKYIPFYNHNNQTILALPNVYNLKILEKIINNLSINSQFIDFSDELVTKYNTNIKNFNSFSVFAALISLLHNIVNNFSKEGVEDIFQIFNSNEYIDLVDWIFFTKDSFKFKRIKANEKIFQILKVQKDPKTGKDIYLVDDFFYWIIFSSLSPYKIEKFFKSFLDMNSEEISKNLFQFLKDDVRFYKNNPYPIYLFKEVFLNQIMGEILMLDDDFKESCKNIAGTIGQAFYKDIGLLSKFAYATDDSSFKDYISESFFLMAKRSALDKKTEFYSNIKDMDVFFEGLTSENFKETKSYFVSFMSSSALHKKWRDNKDKIESEGGE